MARCLPGQVIVPLSGMAHVGSGVHVPFASVANAVRSELAWTNAGDNSAAAITAIASLDMATSCRGVSDAATPAVCPLARMVS
jgi:hypothetical protein